MLVLAQLVKLLEIEGAGACGRPGGLGQPSVPRLLLGRGSPVDGVFFTGYWRQAQKRKPAEEAAEREMLCFETITLAPIDRNLVTRDLLDRDETTWFDAYHARVRATIGPLVDAETAAWLEQATAPIA